MLSSQPALTSAGWMPGGCRGEDPEIFFPIAAAGPALDQVSAAKAICSGCTVRQPCLSYAATTMQDGIWDGTTRDERPATRSPID
jgi:WhiB family transcriptional regulator, redox-sensing transcriptional regulator